VTLAAVGDVLMHDAVKRSAATFGAGGPDAGFAWLFEPIADLLTGADLAFANLETPIAPRGGGTREFVFNASPDVVRALQRSGVDVVAVANNHAFDQQRAGFEETIATLDGLAMRHVGAGPTGAAHGPERFEVGGIRVAFLAWAHFFNQEGNDCPKGPAAPCTQAALLDRVAAVEAVRAAASDADAVVVSLHWGDEYQPQPKAEDVELAHRLAEAGATVIIGHHPHVLQPIELYRRADGRTTVIAYSLGNFISNQSRGYVFGVTPDKAAATRDGALLQVELVRRDYGRGAVEVEVGGAGYLPLWTENDAPEIDPAKEPGRRQRIRVVSVDRALAEVRATLAELPDPLPPGRRADWIRLRRAEALLLARKEAIGRVLGQDLERPAPPRAPPVSSPSAP
jgi:poly-gamma-glutamate synthesis protein (capsule biosynthesis protein)